MKRAAALCALGVFLLAAPAAGAAEFGIVPDSFKISMLDAEGHPELRAGSHPDRLQIDFALNVEGTSARDLEFELPPGFAGDPRAVPACPRELYEGGEECPPESQVGALTLELSGGGELTLPIFEQEPGPGEPFSLVSAPGFNAPLAMELRPGDFGITFRASELPEVAFSQGHIELWGVPADHQTGAPITRHPFLTLPTRCGPLSIVFRTRSKEPDAPWLSAATESEALTGCAELSFAPQLGLQLANPTADSPTGVTMEISTPENVDPDGTVGANMRNASIAMPEGLTVSPGGAAGLVACSDAQLGLGKAGEAACPAASKVGAVEIATPELSAPLTGNVYLGEERPGERFRMFLVAPGPGVVVKAVSVLDLDPATGRLSATLRDLPQVPLSRLSLRFEGGSHALLASPLTCGSYLATGDFEPYGGAPSVRSSTSVTIAPLGGSPCSGAAPFSPGLTTTSSSHAAGRSTAISITLVRRPGEQLTRRFSVSLPNGLGAALGAIRSCSDAGIASGVCPAGSGIGTAQTTVGAGSDTVGLDGAVYAAGPYHQAPFSMAILFRAAMGPFDLGTMALRVGLRVNPRNGRITVVSDPLPDLVEGIPIRFQTVRMALDRAGVISNPTSCRRAAFDAELESGGGAVATAASALPVSRCNRLGFKPRFTLDLTGRTQLHRGGKPGLRIAARFRRGDADLRAMHMSLPAALKFRLAGLGEVCSSTDAVDGLCSPRARVGTAVAQTPLLGEPLKGPIYVVQPKKRGLPELFVGLGQGGIGVDVRGQASVRHGRFVANLVGLPDISLSEFTMRLQGGEHGVLALGVSPCVDGRIRRLTSPLVVDGQNGVRRKLQLRTRADCAR